MGKLWLCLPRAAGQIGRCKPCKHHPVFISYRESIDQLALSLHCIMADEDAPPEVHHYSSLHEVPWDIQK